MYKPLVRLLLIEDDEDDYVITRDLLSEITGSRFELEWISTYQEAWDAILQRSHDVYLVDYRLGGQNGLDLLRGAIARGCQAPMILLTGHSDRDVDIAAMKAGAADYLVKGTFDALMLERVIRYNLERSRTMERLQQALREKSQLTSAIDNLTTSVVITDPKRQDNPILFVNPAFTTITGYTAEEVIGRNCRFLQGPDTDRATLAAIRTAVREHTTITCTLLNYRKDGTPFWNELIISPVFDVEGNLVNFVGLQTDVTERKRNEAALRESEERYALAVQGANDGIWDWNLKTGEVYFSARWKAMLGYQDNELDNVLDEWFERIHPDDVNWFKFRISAHLDGLTPHFEHEHRMLHRDGRYRWMLCRGLAVRDRHNQVTRMAGSQTDTTARKQAEEQLLHDAFHDALTGLPNRTLLLDRLRHALQLTRRNSLYQFAVLFLDIDRFKMVNDSLGHIVGDRLLMAIAQRLSSYLRPGDTIARLGGDEFVILLEDIKDVMEVTAIADQILQGLAQSFNLNGREIFTTASIGIALSETGYEWSEDLLRDADTAMYRAKAEGKACYKVFNTAMHDRAVALLQLETDLRRARDRQEFVLYYQPIVCLRTCHIVGFEALLRWNSPERGLVPPGEFIPLLEETGLIIPIGQWIVFEACRQTYQWHQDFPDRCPVSISVNLSTKQLTSSLVPQVQQILQDTKLDGHSLKLEITESALMENADSATAIMTDLQSMGVSFSMDDFGTGYSSLAYLHRFPIDILKIDRSFVNKIDQDGEQLAITRTIVSLAWNLGMEVVAEGIDSNKQLAQMRALQCEYAQGYLFSPPVTSEQATQLLLSQNQNGFNACPWQPPDLEASPNWLKV